MINISDSCFCCYCFGLFRAGAKTKTRRNCESERELERAKLHVELGKKGV